MPRGRAREIGPASFLRPLFPVRRPIMEPVTRKGGGAVTTVYVDSVFVLNALMDREAFFSAAAALFQEGAGNDPQQEDPGRT